MGEMKRIIEGMAGYVCDGLCKYNDGTLDQDGADDICARCEMGKHIRNVLDEYGRAKGHDYPLWSAGIMDRFLRVN